jgi:hypothetical protein
MEKVIYRIYTEYQENLIPLVKAHFNNATIYEGIGIYKGISEKCVIIEIIGNLETFTFICSLADIIKKEYNQESVLITIQDIKVIYE